MLLPKGVSLIQEILADIDAYYGADSRQAFLKRMEETGWSPLLSPTPKTLRFENPGRQRKILRATVDFTSARNPEELFDAFCSLSQNTITIDDYRLDPAYFARLYSSPAYFVFHGDGFCSSLGFLFQGLAKKLLGANVELKYCRTPDGIYTHVYSILKETIFDPALKCRYPLRELDTYVPAAWFYTLLKRVGMQRFFEIPEEDRKIIFSASTLKHMDIMNSGNFQAVYRRDADINAVFETFKFAVKNHTQEISVERDDFSWKASYRKAVENFLDTPAPAYFMGGLENFQSLDWELPENASLVIGPAEQGDRLLKDLEYVFFGRYFARLNVKLQAGTEITLKIPDLPWFLRSNSLRTLKAGLHESPLRDVSRDPQHAYLGQELLRSACRFLKDGSYELILRADESGSVELIFPFNNLMSSRFTQFGELAS